MDEKPVIIIGAGAAGLIAARELLRHKKKALILEARDRVGGRIYTINGQPYPLEAGAEFIHGNLAMTLGLLKEYHINYYKTGGRFEQIENGKVKEQHDFIKGWDKLLKKMSHVKEDMRFADFLSAYFDGEKFATLRESARRYAEGFDVADISKVSTMELYEEWSEEDDDSSQYRVENGYQSLINALYDDCKKMGCEVHLSHVVKKIEWQKNNVKVYTQAGTEFVAEKVLITVPLGVLRAPASEKSSITFIPEIAEPLRAMDQIGFGSVVKILFECRHPFWDQKAADAGFFFTDVIIPTWWTQYPRNNTLFTGWLGGPKADSWRKKTNEMILEVAIQSVSSVFGASSRPEILKGHVFNWGNDPFSLGAYSYPVLGTKSARKLLNQPINGTLFFAGEAFHEGGLGGTVEAALLSGHDAARQLVEN